MKSILIPIVLTVLTFGGFGYTTYKKNHTPRTGQVWIRDIETSYGRPNHVDTILIIRTTDQTVTFTKLNVYDEWNCTMSTVMEYGTLLK